MIQITDLIVFMKFFIMEEVYCRHVFSCLAVTLQKNFIPILRGFSPHGNVTCF